MSITAERRREEKEQRREQIVDAAEVVFAGGGYDRATLADVAKQARLSRGLIYFYFADKEDLYAAVTLRALEKLRARFEAASASRATGLEKVEAVGREYVRFAETDPDSFHALNWEECRETAPAQDGPFGAACADEGCVVMSLVVGLVEQGIADGSIRPDAGDPAAVALSLKALVHGMTLMRMQKEFVARQLGQSMDRVLEQGFAMLRRSLAANG